MIPVEAQDLLTHRKFGITFPCASGCQMRFRHDGGDLGGFFSYASYGGIRQAVEAAIKRNQELCKQFGRKRATGKPAYRADSQSSSNTGVSGVSGSEYQDSRRNKTYYRYAVRWACPDGRKRIKTFNVMAPYTSDQLEHARRSAIAFRKEWEARLDEFQPQMFQLWREYRLYDEGHPPVAMDLWN